MLQGYADEHVPHPLVQALRKRGVDIVTVQDRQRQGADDIELLSAALAEQRVMLTDDHDFLVLAAECAATHKTFAPIISWPQQRRSIGQLVRRVIRELNRDDYAGVCSQVYFL